jgi:hypothetical protein
MFMTDSHLKHLSLVEFVLATPFYRARPATWKEYLEKAQSMGKQLGSQWRIGYDH